MGFADGVRGDSATLEAAAVDPSLDRDVCFSFELEVAFLRVLAVVVPESALDIDGMRVMPFDQVAVVAVHRPHEVGERGHQAFGQRAPEPGALLHQFEGEIGQGGAMAGAVADQQRLHQRDSFAAILCRFYVRYYVRFFVSHNVLYINCLNKIKKHISPLKSPLLCPLQDRGFGSFFKGLVGLGTGARPAFPDDPSRPGSRLCPNPEGLGRAMTKVRERVHRQTPARGLAPMPII